MKKNNTTPKKIEIKQLYDDYAYKDDIWNEEDYNITKLKLAINKLSTPDQILLYLYAELGTYAQVAKTLNVSIGSIANEIKSIRQQINNILNNNTKNEITTNNSSHPNTPSNNSK